MCWPILLWLHRIAQAEQYLWQAKFHKQLQDVFNASRVIVAELKQWGFSITHNTLLSNSLLQWTNKTLQWCNYLKPCSVQIQHSVINNKKALKALAHTEASQSYGGYGKGFSFCSVFWFSPSNSCSSFFHMIRDFLNSEYSCISIHPLSNISTVCAGTIYWNGLYWDSFFYYRLKKKKKNNIFILLWYKGW